MSRLSRPTAASPVIAGLFIIAAAAQAQEAGPAPAAAGARLEAASAAFEARMESFGARAGALSGDPSLSEAERGRRIAALWSEYAPDVAAFTTQTTLQASRIAAGAMQDIDVDALVEQAMNDPEIQQALEGGAATAAGLIRNSAWTSPDPEQLETYGLIARYALDQADGVVSIETPAPPAPPAPPAATEAPRL